MNEKAVKDALRKLVQHPEIQDIVFTGGEPTANPTLLQELVSIAQKKNVYINTTLPRDNFFKSLEIFNSGMVNGVNISRHTSSYEKDSKLFHNIVEDWALDGIKVPVKINVVLNEKATTQEVAAVIDRWKPHGNVSVCFRRDFRKTTPETLHVLSGDPILDYLVANYEYLGHTFCDVCDTVRFSNNISLHRGLEQSSIRVGNNVIVNDIIVFPDGFVAYDWDRKPVSDLDNFMPAPKNSRNTINRSMGCGHTNVPTSAPYVSSCGVGGCGAGARHSTPPLYIPRNQGCGGGGGC
jgi:organic radical activating enzyme